MGTKTTDGESYLVEYGVTTQGKVRLGMYRIPSVSLLCVANLKMQYLFLLKYKSRSSIGEKKMFCDKCNSVLNARFEP